MTTITPASKPDNDLILERLRRKSVYTPPSASVQALARRMLELIKAGEIGLVFNDPDDCDRDWSDAAVIEFVKVMLLTDRKFLINEILEESIALHYPMQKLMELHPDYWNKVKDWELDNDIKRPRDAMEVNKEAIEGELCAKVVPYKLPILRQG